MLVMISNLLPTVFTKPEASDARRERGFIGRFIKSPAQSGLSLVCLTNAQDRTSVPPGLRTTWARSCTRAGANDVSSWMSGSVQISPTSKWCMTQSDRRPSWVLMMLVARFPDLGWRISGRACWRRRWRSPVTRSTGQSRCKSNEQTQKLRSLTSYCCDLRLMTCPFSSR